MREERDEYIHVLTVLGKKYSVPLQRATNVARLKEQLHALSGILPEKQHIIINGVLCKDPKFPLQYQSEELICILAEKVEEKQQKSTPKTRSPEKSHNSHSQKHYYDHFNKHDLKYQRWLNKKQQQIYLEEVLNSYSKEVVNKIMTIMQGIDKELAIRAARACQNQLEEAIDFIDLEMRGQNFKEMDIQLKPVKEHMNEQEFLTAYVSQQNLTRKLSSSRQAYLLFVASMKEKSPIIFQMLIRNRLYMQKLLFDYKNSHQQLTQCHTPHVTSTKKYQNLAIQSTISSLRVKISQQERRYILNILESNGMPKGDAVFRLRQAGNHLSYAIQRMLENNRNINTKKLIQTLPLACKQRIVHLFFQSPAWDALKIKLQSFSINEGYQIVIRKLNKHFPYIFSFVGKDKLWCIYPLLFGISFSQIHPMDLIIKTPPIQLKRRSMKDLELIHKHYYSLVDKELVSIFKRLGIDVDFAQRAVRAAANNPYHAAQLILAGKIPIVPDGWCQQNQKNQLIMIQFYMEQSLLHFIGDFNEFQIQVASLAQRQPTLYQAFANFEGIYQTYRYLGNYTQQINTTSFCKYTKDILSKKPGIRQFYEQGYKSLMILYR